MNKLIICFCLFIVQHFVFGQTLFTIEGEEVDTDEFKKMYERSEYGSDYSKKSVNDFLDVYIAFKLKLKEAKAEGIADDPEVLREIAMYEEQLIQSEFDQEMMNDLLEEVQQRLKEEICAKHILIEIRRHPTPQDTLDAYNQAVDIRNMALGGSSFKDLAQKYSRDLETKYNAGDLGCFTALQLSSYDLENAVFHMNKGDISMPVRTRYGYHIIKIEDRRPSNGLAQATQIFVRANNSQENEENETARYAIFNAYQSLESGEDFNDVARKLLSEEKLVASKDKIDWFSVGTYEASFENTIFALDEKGDYSKPLKTSLGWHIFQLEGRKPLPEFKEIEQNLRDKIREDERYFKAKMSFSNRIKQKYDFEKNQENIDLFIKEVARGIGIKGWQIPSIYDLNNEFFTIDGDVFTARDFVNYVRDQHSVDRFYDFDFYYDSFESNHLLEHHKSNLIEDDPELYQLLNEYRDGIILFSLMEKELFDVQSPTEADLMNFYEENKDQYRSPDELVMGVYEIDSKNRGLEKKLSKAIRRNKGESTIKRLGSGIKVSEMTMSVEEANIDGKNLSKEGDYASVKEGDFIKYYLVRDVIKGLPQKYSEVKSKVIIDYQKELEKNWTKNLEKKYSVSINENAVESLYK